jgi:hypothetical protein
MIVKELVKKLQEFDESDQVYLSCECGYVIESVDIVESSKNKNFEGVMLTCED